MFYRKYLNVYGNRALRAAPPAAVSEEPPASGVVAATTLTSATVAMLMKRRGAGARRLGKGSPELSAPLAEVLSEEVKTSRCCPPVLAADLLKDFIFVINALFHFSAFVCVKGGGRMLSEEESQALARWADELDRAPPVRLTHMYTYDTHTHAQAYSSCNLFALILRPRYIVVGSKHMLPSSFNTPFHFACTREGCPACARVRGTRAECFNERRAIVGAWPEQRSCQHQW